MLAILLATAISTTPADEVRAAANDVASLPIESRPNVRYLTLYNLDASQRRQTEQAVGYVLNALSRSRAISRPRLVSPTLLRFDIAQYAPEKHEFKAWFGAWEKLAEIDPYFHLPAEVVDQGGRRKSESGFSGRDLSPLRVPNSALKVVTTDGGWIDLKETRRLRDLTGSAGAILRADFFIAHATVPPHYHNFAGIPATESEFLKSLGVDRDVINRLRANAGANLVMSGVTGKPRRVIWSQGPLGGVYATLDVDRVDATRDPLRRPVSAEGLTLQYDASEWFAVAPNGLWRTAIFDAAGKRQDTVPDRVAKDTSDPQGDGIIVPMLSCIRCHREGGLRPFRDDQSRLLAGRVDLFSYDPKIVQRAAEFYDEPRLQRQMEFDRQTYAQAVARATGGMKPEELTDRLAERVRKFAYLPVTIEQAAIEVGLTTDKFRRAMLATRDPVILLLLENRTVLRGQWESSFAEAALMATAFLNEFNLAQSRKVAEQESGRK